ncbi:hypothetical protein PUN28_009824 [Cardiocondyla obscurior]|uniref:Uncharacterized protein n=1 Tax=Cardiocondyla obscurior TaxID=286306 RepID=A0AAW2FKG9_9HYME
MEKARLEEMTIKDLRTEAISYGLPDCGEEATRASLIATILEHLERIRTIDETAAGSSASGADGGSAEPRGMAEYYPLTRELREVMTSVTGEISRQQARIYKRLKLDQQQEQRDMIQLQKKMMDQQEELFTFFMQALTAGARSPSDPVGFYRRLNRRGSTRGRRDRSWRLTGFERNCKEQHQATVDQVQPL